VIDTVLARIDPHAGSAYAAMRAWNVLMWQPVLVAVLCTEAEGRAARVDHAGYRLGPDFGCHLEELPEKAPDARDKAAWSLARTSAAIFDALSTRLRLRAELARRQMADRVLGVLHRRALLGLATTPQTRRTASDWLIALDLDGLSALEPMPLEDGGEGLWLCRRSCCLEYRARPDFLCATCPRRARNTRIALSRQEWQTHVRA
jgi:siderophore ferric iron reductase